MFSLFFFNGTTPTEIYTLSLHDALPILGLSTGATVLIGQAWGAGERDKVRSEEHTSELQSRFDLVCRLLLEKKKQFFRRVRVGSIEIRGLMSAEIAAVGMVTMRKHYALE